MKECRTCPGLKPLSEFNLDPRTKDGRKGQCRSCTSAAAKEYRNRPEQKEKVAARIRKARQANAEHYRQYQKNWKLAKRYGLARDQYDRMVEEAGGVCPVCGEEAELVVDHNHRTKIVRGMVCNKCNQAIGLMRDKSKLMRQAAEWLDRVDPGAADTVQAVG